MVRNFSESFSLINENKVNKLKRIFDEIRLDEELFNQVNALSIEEQAVFYDALKQFIEDDVKILLIYMKAQKLIHEGCSYE